MAFRFYRQYPPSSQVFPSAPTRASQLCSEIFKTSYSLSLQSRVGFCSGFTPLSRQVSATQTRRACLEKHRDTTRPNYLIKKSVALLPLPWLTDTVFHNFEANRRPKCMQRSAIVSRMKDIL